MSLTVFLWLRMRPAGGAEQFTPINKPRSARRWVGALPWGGAQFWGVLRRLVEAPRD